MREDAHKYEMVYSPYPPYEILKTDTISYAELIKLKKVEEMVDKYYNSKKFCYIIKYFEKRQEIESVSALTKAHIGITKQ
jgi:hypothetical protein